MKARRFAAAIALAGLAAVAGCSSESGSTSRAPVARIERQGNGMESIVLSPVGASRIGVRTTVATASGAGTTVPYSALLYEPDGATAVYVNTEPLVYTRYIVVVGSIDGSLVRLSRGLQPGVKVVTVGAEELLGVQNGVGEET